MQVFYRWVASVGGLDGLEWFLMRREELGLDADLTDAQADWLEKLNRLASRALVQRQQECAQLRQQMQLTREQRFERIMQRKLEDDERRIAIYSHVPAQRKLSLAERMAAAWERLNAA